MTSREGVLAAFGRNLPLEPADATDRKGRSLTRLVSANSLSEEGDFAVFTLRPPSGKRRMAPLVALAFSAHARKRPDPGRPCPPDGH